MSRCLTITLSIFSLTVLATLARADVNEKVKMWSGPKDSGDFAMRAAEGGMYEVKLAQLAQQKGSSAEVKDLAKRLEQEHTAANTELMALAKQKNITLPSQLEGECAEAYQAFQKLDGPAFDNAFMLCQVTNHLATILMFQNESRNGTDADIKQWASKTLPTLREHTAKIGAVAQSVGLPIDALNSMRGEGARPAGGRIEGTNDGGGTKVNPK